jgi:hypothetical protein
LGQYVIQGYIPHDHQINIAFGVLISSRYRPIDQSKGDLCGKRGESGTKLMKDARGFCNQRMNFRKRRVIPVRLAEDQPVVLRERRGWSVSSLYDTP